jgi:transcriptional regulator with XRE-family HTH domain
MITRKGAMVMKTKENIYKTIGKNVRLFRKKERMTLNDLSEKTGISPSFLSNIENGSRQATLLIFEKIAAALKINLTSLFIKREKNPPSSSNDAAVMLNIIKLINEKSPDDKKKILNMLKCL